MLIEFDFDGHRGCGLCLSLPRLLAYRLKKQKETQRATMLVGEQWSGRYMLMSVSTGNRPSCSVQQASLAKAVVIGWQQ